VCDTVYIWTQDSSLYICSAVTVVVHLKYVNTSMPRERSIYEIDRDWDVSRARPGARSRETPTRARAAAPGSTAGLLILAL
jgi:hypothetical protein